ncbi:uncharacterized protein G2W53_040688 [Senna tora]|uniref:Uncharacterized protein n=1 Tax=Senna tora TaxID=362788 RepID=A0A834VY60_9FABA|nr:uncharacterized protein G2W53_040688 [Senna tora]
MAPFHCPPWLWRLLMEYSQAKYKVDRSKDIIQLHPSSALPSLNLVSLSRSASVSALVFSLSFTLSTVVEGLKLPPPRSLLELGLRSRSNPTVMYQRQCLPRQVRPPKPRHHEDHLPCHKSTQENAISALSKLAKHNDGKEVIMVEEELEKMKRAR